MPQEPFDLAVFSDPQLLSIFSKLNEKYFDYKLHARITWAKLECWGQCSVPTLHRRVGHIEISDILRPGFRFKRTKDAVSRLKPPKHYLEFVIYHEMLHLVVPSRTTKGGAYVHHTKEFKDREKLFEHYDELREWECGPGQYHFDSKHFAVGTPKYQSELTKLDLYPWRHKKVFTHENKRWRIIGFLPTNRVYKISAVNKSGEVSNFPLESIIS